MKMPFRVDSLLAEDAIAEQIPIKVCMLVLQRASADPRVMRDATALREAGFAVCIVDVESERTLPREENIGGICVKHIIMPGWFVSTHFKPWFLVKLVVMIIVSTIQLLRIQADIYHAHIEKALPACYIVARLRHKPLIFEAPELPLSGPIFTRWRVLTALSRYLLALMVRHCTGVITVSPPIAQELCNRYHLPEVITIRNVPPYRAVEKTDRLRQHLGLSPETRVALYQGGLQPDRRLDKLVHAATFLKPNIVIVLMGSGEAAVQSQLEALIVSDDVADRVKILPPVPYAELLEWTASADLGFIIYPPDYSLNIQWCLPNKLFEYLMAGLPVLASQLEAVTEILRTYNAGQIVSSLAPADVGAAINSMLADPLALARMRHNALCAAQDCCWDKEQQQLIHLYQNILTK